MPRVAQDQRKRSYRPKTRSGCITCKCVLLLSCYCPNRWLDNGCLALLSWQYNRSNVLPTSKNHSETKISVSAPSEMRWGIAVLPAMRLNRPKMAMKFPIRQRPQAIWGLLPLQWSDLHPLDFFARKNVDRFTSSNREPLRSCLASLGWFLGEAPASSDSSQSLYSTRNHCPRISARKIITR